MSRDIDPPVDIGIRQHPCLVIIGIGILIQPSIDLRYLLHPEPAFLVIHVHQLQVWPVNVVRQVGYLSEQPFARVA